MLNSRTRGVLLVAAVVASVATGIDAQAATTPGSGTTFVFNGEGNRLNVYDATTGDKATVIHAATDASVDPVREHKDLNAQICFQRRGKKTYFIAGEDTGQGQVGEPGWGWFEVRGLEHRDVSKVSTVQRGKLVPSYAGVEGGTDQGGSNPENYGCGFLDSGALVLSDVGDQQPDAQANGQLHVWFPDPSGGFGKGFTYAPGAITDVSDIRYCKIDIAVPTAGGIAVDRRDPRSTTDDVVYLAASRPDTADPSKGWGIYKYEGVGALTPSMCDHSGHVRGEPLTPAIDSFPDTVKRSVFIQGGAPQMTPSAIVASGNGSWYVSSVFDGNIAEYSADGLFQRYVVGAGPLGQVSGALGLPDAIGTPYGLGVTPDGAIWYADIGVIGNDTARPGRVMKATLQAAPLTTLPATVDEGLDYPDGIGILSY